MMGAIHCEFECHRDSMNVIKIMMLMAVPVLYEVQ